jgi:hypothetical protein
MRDNQLDGAPGRIRTADPQIRRLLRAFVFTTLFCKIEWFITLMINGLADQLQNEIEVRSRQSKAPNWVRQRAGPCGVRFGFAEPALQDREVGDLRRGLFGRLARMSSRAARTGLGLETALRRDSVC